MKTGNLELRKAAAGARYYLDGKIVQPSGILELLHDGEWIEGHFEWDGSPETRPYLLVDIGKFSHVRLHGPWELAPNAVLRWPKAVLATRFQPCSGKELPCVECEGEGHRSGTDEVCSWCAGSGVHVIPDCEAMARQVSGLRGVLEGLASGEFPDSADYVLDDLRRLCASLVEGQRNDIVRLKPGSWCVAPTGQMPSDERFQFSCVPTYIAVGILVRVQSRFPEVAAGIPGFDRALHTGMKFASYRLYGHGYDSEAGMIEAVRLLGLGDVPRYLTRHADASPELLAQLRDIKKSTQVEIKEGRTTGTWGEDFVPGYRRVIEVLRDIDVP